MTPNIDRRKFLTGAGTVATVALAGCGGDDPVEDVDGTTDDGTSVDGTGDDESEPSDGDDGSTESESDDSDGSTTDPTLQLMQIQQQTLDPIGIAGPASAGVNWQTHEQLFTYAQGTTPVTGQLAADYSVSEDYLTYTFELQEGVQFHNGDELTADDVVYSWRRLAESENNRGHGNRIVGGVMSVAHETEGEGEDEDLVPNSLALEAVDDYTLEMTLETPFHGTLGMLADPRFSPIPEGIVGDIEGYEGELSYEEWSTEQVHGTGPFALATWERGSEIVVERFEDYHGSSATLSEIRWQITADPNAQFIRAVNEQNADIFQLPRSQFDPSLLEVEEDLGDGRRRGTYGPVANGATLNYGEATLPRTQYLLFHTLQVEKPARLAIAHVMNQETVTQTATRGQGKPAYFLTPPAVFPDGPENYNDLAASGYPYGYGQSNIDAATQVMEDAGYSESNPYEVAFQHPSDEQGSEWREVASLLQDLSEPVHIDLQVEEVPSTTLTNRAIEGDIEIMGTWNELEWQEADATLQFAYPNPYTWTRWGQGEEGLSEAAQQAADAWERYENHRTPGDDNQEVRNESYLDLERANWADMTQLPLWHPVSDKYWYDWVENYEMHGPQHSYQYNDLSLGDRS
jgi:peptide/nickel transport system substrate-binding protein